VSNRSFRGLSEEAQKHPGFHKELAILEFTEELWRIMQEEGVTATELGRRIGSSQAYISRVLNGGANFTLGSMTKLAMALGKELKMHLAPARMVTTWRDYSPAPQTTGAGAHVFEVDFREPGGAPARYAAAPATSHASVAIADQEVSDGRTTSAA
jgi:transcriptional regulator with XRE-family HTH domain